MYELVTEYFKDKLNSPSTLTKAIKTAPTELIDYLTQLLEKEPEWEKLSYLIIGLVTGTQLKTCLYCGKKLKYSKSKSNSYCCNSHAQLDSRTRDKITKTCLERYGAIAPTLNESVLQKRNKNNLAKYGVENPISLIEIQNKRQLTCNEKYGGNSPICSDKIKEKMKNTMVERYGVEHNMQVDLIKDKARETNKRKQYKTFIKYSHFVKPLFTEEEFITGGCLKWECVECGNIFEQDKIYSTGHLTHIDKHLFDCPRCLNCYPSDL